MTTVQYEITERQAEVLEFIVAYLSEHDSQPTYREIGKALGIRNVNGVVCHIKALVEKGYISKKAKYLSRSLQIDWDMYQAARKVWGRGV